MRSNVLHGDSAAPQVAGRQIAARSEGRRGLSVTESRVTVKRTLASVARAALRAGSNLLGPIRKELARNPQVAGPKSRLSIHPTAYVGEAYLNTRSGTITIGKYAFFGHQVMVLTGRHDPSRRGRDRQLAIPTEGCDVVVEDGAWVASRAILIGPCVVGRDAVVAAGSVVTEDVAPGVVVAGVPARVIKTLTFD